MMKSLIALAVTVAFSLPALAQSNTGMMQRDSRTGMRTMHGNSMKMRNSRSARYNRKGTMGQSMHNSRMKTPQ